MKEEYLEDSLKNERMTYLIKREDIKLKAKLYDLWKKEKINSNEYAIYTTFIEEIEAEVWYLLNQKACIYAWVSTYGRKGQDNVSDILYNYDKLYFSAIKEWLNGHKVLGVKYNKEFIEGLINASNRC